MMSNYDYNIVRLYKDAAIRRRVLEYSVTLEEAQKHCSDPETSSSTCTSSVGKRRTKRIGPWFDAYESINGKR